jgi:hypothetical protein
VHSANKATATLDFISFFIFIVFEVEFCESFLVGSSSDGCLHDFEDHIRVILNACKGFGTTADGRERDVTGCVGG